LENKISNLSTKEASLLIGELYKNWMLDNCLVLWYNLIMGFEVSPRYR
jgi:hypothetical protein